METSDDELSIFSCDEKISFIDLLNEDESKQIYENGNRIIYRCLIKYLVEALNDNEIIFSENNRMVDTVRLKTFNDFESIKCDPIILGLRLDKNSKFDIIDGQHRITFFNNIEKLNIIKKNTIMNDFIPIDIRVCKNETDYKKFIDSTNNRKNFTFDQLRIYKYPLLQQLLNNEFNNIFTAPYIKVNENEFKVHLFKSHFYDNFDNTAEIIFTKIKSINSFLQNLDDKSKLSTERDFTKKSYIKKRDKAEKAGLFLGIDCNFKYMDLLDYEESQYNEIWNEFFQKKTIKKIIKNN